MQKNKTTPQKMFLFPVLAISLLLMMFLPFTHDKAYAVTNTDTPTVTLTSTPAFTFTPTVTATMAGSLNCGTTTTAGIVCTKVSPSLLKYTGSFMPASSPSQIQMSFIKNFTGKVYFRMEEQGAGDFVYSHWIGTNPIAMQVRYKWAGGTATIGNVGTTHYPWTKNNSAFEVMNPGVQDFQHSDAPDGMTSHAFVVWGNDPVNGKLIYFNSYIGKNNGNIINNSGAPVATGGGAMYISAYPIAFTPTPTATMTFTSTPTATTMFMPTPTSPPTCLGITCDGWNPIDKGCDNDAILDYRIRYVQSSDYEASARVENRYSPNCDSQWTRVRSLTVDLIYAEASIRWGGGAYDLYSEDGFIDSQENESVFTNMVGNLGEVRNCGGVSAPPAPMTPTITPAPQPIDPDSDYGLENCILTNHLP